MATADKPPPALLLVCEPAVGKSASAEALLPACSTAGSADTRARGRRLPGLVSAFICTGSALAMPLEMMVADGTKYRLCSGSRDGETGNAAVVDADWPMPAPPEAAAPAPTAPALVAVERVLAPNPAKLASGARGSPADGMPALKLVQPRAPLLLAAGAAAGCRRSMRLLRRLLSVEAPVSGTTGGAGGAAAAVGGAAAVAAAGTGAAVLEDPWLPSVLEPACSDAAAAAAPAAAAVAALTAADRAAAAAVDAADDTADTLEAPLEPLDAAAVCEELPCVVAMGCVGASGSHGGGTTAGSSGRGTCANAATPSAAGASADDCGGAPESLRATTPGAAGAAAAAG